MLAASCFIAAAEDLRSNAAAQAGYCVGEAAGVAHHANRTTTGD